MFEKEFSFDLYFVPQVGWEYSHNSLLARPFNRSLKKHLRRLQEQNMLPDDPHTSLLRIIMRRSFFKYEYVVTSCHWQDWVDGWQDLRRR